MTFNNLLRYWILFYEYLIWSSIVAYTFTITAFAGSLIKYDIEKYFEVSTWMSAYHQASILRIWKSH